MAALNSLLSTNFDRYLLTFFFLLAFFSCLLFLNSESHNFFGFEQREDKYVLSEKTERRSDLTRLSQSVQLLSTNFDRFIIIFFFWPWLILANVTFPPENSESHNFFGFEQSEDKYVLRRRQSNGPIWQDYRQVFNSCQQTLTVYYHFFFGQKKKFRIP